MWGLFSSGDVPTTPDPTLLKEFYDRFSSETNLEATLTSVLRDAAAPQLIGTDQVIVLRSLRGDPAKKLARGMGHIQEIHILIVHGMLARVGMRVWAPDLLAPIDSPWNSACQVTALETFRELSSVYAGMKIKLKFNDSIDLLIRAYNHYVFVNMAQKYKDELKEAGKAEKLSKRKRAQKGRERVRDSFPLFLLIDSSFDFFFGSDHASPTGVSSHQSNYRPAPIQKNCR